MIPHDARLDRGYGAVAWEPVVTVTPVVGGVPGAPVSVVGGDVTHDAGAWPRTTATLVLPTAVTAAQTTPPAMPWGDQVLVDVAFRVAGQLLPAFRAATLDVHTADVDRPSGTLTLGCVSQEARVNEDRYDTRTATTAGTATDVITALVRRTLGAGWPVRLGTITTNLTLAAGAFTLEDDVWPTVEAIADASGLEAFFDYDGALVIRDTPRTTSAPHVQLTTGDGGTLTGYRSRRQWAHNRVALVYQEGNDPADPRRVGVWQDTAAASPTRVTGPYGRHTRRDVIDVEPGKLPTQAVADAAAADVAKRAAAPFRSTTLRAIPCPWIQPGDTARLVLLGGLTEDHLVESITWPLSLLDVATITTTDDTYTGRTI